MAEVTIEELLDALQRELEELEVLELEAEERCVEAEILDSETQLNYLTRSLYIRTLALPADEVRADPKLIESVISLFQAAQKMISRDQKCKKRIRERLTELQRRKQAVLANQSYPAP